MQRFYHLFGLSVTTAYLTTVLFFLDKNIVIYNHLFLLRVHCSKAGELVIPLNEVLKESGPILNMTLALRNIYLLLLKNGDWLRVCWQRSGLSGTSVRNHLPDRFNLKPITQPQLWNAETPASQSVCGDNFPSTRFVIWTCWCVWGWKTTSTERPVLRNDPSRLSPFSHGMCDQLSGQLQRFKPDTFHGVFFKLTPQLKSPGWGSAYLGKVSQLVCIQQQFLQTPIIAINLIGHKEQRAVAFIDQLHMTVAPPQGDTVKHHGGGAN